MYIRTRDEQHWHTRELMSGYQAACWLTVIDHTMRIGTTTVRMAGIGGVETRREFRMRGLMRILFTDTIQYMQHEGYDVSMLFGIPGFYDKFGYAVSLAWSTVTIETRDAELASADAMPIRTRAVAPSDLPTILDLYQRCNSTRTCSLLRPPERFKGIVHGSHWDRSAESAVIEDVQGHFAGYLAWDKLADATNVIEVACTDERLYPSVLVEMARQAVEKRCAHLTFNLPPDHSFGQFLQRYGCTWNIWHPRNGDGMLRILNQANLFNKIKPELDSRVAASSFRHDPLSLVLRTELGETMLNFGPPNSHTIGTIDLSQDRLMQMITGYRSARDVLNDPAVHISTFRFDFSSLLDVLFPECHPYMWSTDCF